MKHFNPADDDWQARARASFARQGIMETLDARLGQLSPGKAEILLDFHERLSQQHGVFHAGVISTIADSAGAFAAYSLFPPSRSIVSVEFKINMLNPADGERLRAAGEVLKCGRTLSICEVEVYILKQGSETLCAKMQQTLFQVADKGNA